MDVLHVRDLRLWAHVGVLESERRDGQWFVLDLSFQLDLSSAAADDDLGATLDYSEAIIALQDLARTIRCLTIEHFSEQVLDRLDAMYGAVPVWLRLSKCSPPIAGFTGTVMVERSRHGATAPR